MNKKELSILTAFIALIILVGGYFIIVDFTNDSLEESNLEDEHSEEKQIISEEFNNPKKTPHWEYNVPSHGSVLPAIPINIVLGFNFDLHEISSISITKEGEEYGIGETKIEGNNLIMRRDMRENSPDGIYKVYYDACWPDASCHDGYFEFKVDRSLADSFTDLTGQDEVTIDIKNISFVQSKIKISKGTNINWINNDNFTHFVTSNPHGGHSYFNEMNSKGLNQEDSFSLVLEKPGVYLYHCSAHSQMTGTIIVE